MTDLSLAMIARDNSDTIGAVLGDVAGVCDEVIVVDTGSVDDTREIATGMGAKVSEFEWCDDFSAARNAALDRCSGDWVMWLDSDDRLLGPDKLAVLRDELLAGKQPFDVVFLPYKVDPNPGTGSDPDIARERIFRASLGMRFTYRVHERIVLAPGARSGLFSGAWVEHRPDPAKNSRTRNLRLLRMMYDEGCRDQPVLSHLARTLFDIGEHDESLRLWDEYFDAEATDLVERYLAHIQHAECVDSLGIDGSQEMRLRAVLMRPDRAEAWVTLGEHHRQREEWSQAVPYFGAAAACTRPEALEGVVFGTWYTWLPHDALMDCYVHLGMHAAALYHARMALELGADPEIMQDNIDTLAGMVGDGATPAVIPVGVGP